MGPVKNNHIIINGQLLKTNLIGKRKDYLKTYLKLNLQDKILNHFLVHSIPKEYLMFQQDLLKKSMLSQIYLSIIYHLTIIRRITKQLVKLINLSIMQIIIKILMLQLLTVEPKITLYMAKLLHYLKTKVIHYSTEFLLLQEIVEHKWESKGYYKEFKCQELIIINILIMI